MLVSKVTALLVVCTSAIASDVYSTFQDGGAGRIGDVDFDVGDGGCFAVPNALKVQFSQAGEGIVSGANGPYCLSAWGEGGCSGDARGTQGFNGVSFDISYALIADVQNAGSYKWSTAACP